MHITLLLLTLYFLYSKKNSIQLFQKSKEQLLEKMQSELKFGMDMLGKEHYKTAINFVMYSFLILIIVGSAHTIVYMAAIPAWLFYGSLSLGAIQLITTKNDIDTMTEIIETQKATLNLGVDRILVFFELAYLISLLLIVWFTWGL